MKSEQKKQKKQKKLKEPLTEQESKRKIIIRAILLGVAITVAVIAFSIAMKAYIHKDPGFYTIDANRVEDALLYANGIELTCYFDGSSNEIREAMNIVRSTYSNTLSRLYKLLDPVNTYEGYTNLAYLNQHPGEDVKVDAELYDILNSAYALTMNGRFNMFAGALYSEWQGISILESQEDFDPLLNENEAARIKAISQCVGDLSNFSFEAVDPYEHIVRFTVSDEYKKFAEELEINAPVINLAYLKEAYELEYTAAEVEKTGNTNGYFTTDEGMTKAMSGVNGGSFIVHTQEQGIAVKACTLDIKASTAFCEFKAFSLNESPMYYTIDVNGETLLRHPHFDYSDGGKYDALISGCAVSMKGDLVSAVIDSYRLITSASENDAAQYVMQHTDGQTYFCFITKAEPKAVRTDNAHTGAIILDEGSVGSVKPIG